MRFLSLIIRLRIMEISSSTKGRSCLLRLTMVSKRRSNPAMWTAGLYLAIIWRLEFFRIAPIICAWAVTIIWCCFTVGVTIWTLGNSAGHWCALSQSCLGSGVYSYILFQRYVIFVLTSTKSVNSVHQKFTVRGRWYVICSTIIVHSCIVGARTQSCFGKPTLY